MWPPFYWWHYCDGTICICVSPYMCFLLCGHPITFKFYPISGLGFIFKGLSTALSINYLILPIDKIIDKILTM